VLGVGPGAEHAVGQAEEATAQGLEGVGLHGNPVGLARRAHPRQDAVPGATAQTPARPHGRRRTLRGARWRPAVPRKLITYDDRRPAGHWRPMGPRWPMPAL